MKILILQGIIPHYRVSIFNSISNSKGVEQVCVTHSDELFMDKNNFDTIFLKKTSIRNFVFQPKLLSLLKDYDVVIGMFDMQFISIMGALIYSRYFINKPFILWGHGIGTNRILDRVRVWLAKKADALLLYYKEPQYTSIYIKHGFPENRIFETANTLEIDNSGFDPNIIRNSFVYVGRTYKIKKLEILVEAFLHLKKCNPEIKTILEIVGEGETLNYLKEISGGHLDIKFYGEILDKNKLKEIFQRSIAYVSPGHCGLGIIHSFAYGIPVITQKYAPHSPEISNLKNLENGVLYEGSFIDLAKVMGDFINNPNKSYEMGYNGFKFYSQYRKSENMVNNFISAINCAIALHKK